MSPIFEDEKPEEIDKEIWDGILSVYSNAEDIDPFTGGLAETSPKDGIVGPLFACIIATQFQSLRDGDRYFFTHSCGLDDNTHDVRGLGKRTKHSIRKRTFGDILCDNPGSDIQGNSTRFQLLGKKKLTQNPPYHILFLQGHR